MTEKRTFEVEKKKNLDLDFYEYVVLFNCLINEMYLASVIDYLEPDYFASKENQEVVKIIKSFFKDRQTAPTATELRSYLVSEEQKAAYKSMIEKFASLKLDSKGDPEELIANTEQFLRERAVTSALIKTANGLDKKEFTSAEVLEVFEKACSINLLDDMGFDYFSHIDQHCDNLKQIDETIPTGFKYLDKKMAGGLLKLGRALYLFVGSTNVGKSVLLGNFAIKLLQQNLKVLIISLEMSEHIYAKRISTQISKIPIFELSTQTLALRDFLTKYKQEHQSMLLIKEFPPQGVTVNHLKTYIKNLQTKRKFKPDVIIVDYVNLIAPAPATGNSYQEMKKITEQLRALTYEFNCPIITASQLNRSGTSKENPDLNTISESMGVSFTCDFQAALWQTKEQKTLGIMGLSIQKNRFGENWGSVTLRFDSHTLTMEEIGEAEFYAGNEEVKGADNALGVLAD